jgi:hypothetical protein
MDEQISSDEGFAGCNFFSFFSAGECAFLQGVLQKNECSAWCFCGEVVVECVVNVVS